MFGKLYIVATPIGNLEDITFRALRVLKEVDIILAEDTRVTSKLTNHYKISTKVLNYHQHSTENKKLEILKRLVEGEKIALVTDGGTPGVSDPGNELIHYILEKEPLIGIVPVPGVSALTTTLSVSAVNVSRFIFAGFMPKKGRCKLSTQVKDLMLPLVFYESPRRIIKTITDLMEFFGDDKEIFIGRELTKMYETLYRGTLDYVQKQLLEEGKVKGEVTVVFLPKSL